MTPEALANPTNIAKNLLAKYDLQTALSRTDSPAVCAELRWLAGVKLEIPTKQVKPMMSRV